MTADQMPKQDTIEKLRSIWHDILDHDQFNNNDSFFDVGGHSLAANVLFEKIKEEFGVKLPNITIFDHETLFELAGVLDKECAQAK